jgi:hypothetical protein
MNWFILVIFAQICLMHGAYGNISNCSNISFTDVLTLKGDSFGIIKKSGSVLDSNGQKLLTFKTDCLAWSATDAQIFLPNSETMVARLDQDNVAIGNRIRLRDCNDNIVAIFQEDIVSSLISLRIRVKYYIKDSSDITIGESDAIHLFDTNMNMYQNNVNYGNFNFPFGEAVKKMWLGEQSAILTFTNQTTSLGESGNERFLSVALGIYYLVLLSLNRDSNGKIQPPMCNQAYRTALILGVVFGCATLFGIGFLIVRYFRKKRSSID